MRKYRAMGLYILDDTLLSLADKAFLNGSDFHRSPRVVESLSSMMRELGAVDTVTDPWPNMFHGSWSLTNQQVRRK